MGTARLVVAEVDRRALPGERLGQQGDQRDHVGLLDDLRALRLLAADHHVDGQRVGDVVPHIQRLQCMEAGKLLVEPGGGIEAGDDARDGVPPVVEFTVVEGDPVLERGGVVGPALPQQVQRVQSTRDVPACHHVGEGVVVHILMVLIRPDDVADVAPAIRFGHGPGGPESRGFDEDFDPGIAEEVVVAGGAPILPDRVCDVGADVVFHLAGQDLDRLPGGAQHRFRCGFLTGIGRLPGIERASVPEQFSLRTGGGQHVVPVHQQRARRFRPDGGVVWQEIGLGIPEDVAEIGIAGQAARTDRHSVVVRVGGARQMVDGEPQGALQIVIAVDVDPAILPVVVPGGLMRPQDSTPAQVGAALQRRLRLRRRVFRRSVRSRHGDVASQFGNLAGLGAPAPDPPQRERALGRDRGSFEAQLCVAGHRHNLARPFGAPSAHFVLETNRLHAETGQTEARFEADVDAIPVQHDALHLQPRRAVCQRQQAKLVARRGDAGRRSMRPFGEQHAAPHVEPPQAAKHLTLA